MPFTSETAKKFRGPGGRKKGDPVQKAAAVIAREFIEAHVQPVLDAYLGLAAGQVVARDGKTFTLLVDPATTRHAIDKILPEIEQDESSRPIAIQVVIETQAQTRSGHANGNGHDAPVEGARNGGPILIGGE